VDDGDDEAADETEGFRSNLLRRFLHPRPGYQLTRFAILRLLGFIYFIAFVSLARQLGPLLGSDGLLPIASFVPRLIEATGSRSAAFGTLPTLFLWLGTSDATLTAC
jgi:hypothetical protein